MMRLQRYLALAGVAARRPAEKLIAAGHVRVNGTVIRVMGTTVDPDHDRVTVNGKHVALPQTFQYLALYKPVGYVTTLADPHAERTLKDLLPPELPRMVPAGRLDRDSEGLLLLTNDGALVDRLTHPRFAHEKEYDVTIAGPVTATELGRLRAGVRLPGGSGRSRPASIVRVRQNHRAGTQTFRIILREGKKRQIRRMFGLLGYPVTRLLRTRIGAVKLETLAPGEYRFLTKSDILQENTGRRA